MWSGHGVARIDDGPIVRVPHVDIGERVRLGPITEHRGRRFATAEILEPSAHRVDPDCAQAHRCPGCPLRHLSAARQAEWKVMQHHAALQRLGQRDDLQDPHGELIHSAPTDGYRTRAVARLLPQPGGGHVLGMRPLPGHSAPIDLAQCPAQAPATRTVLHRWAQALSAAGVTPFDAETNPDGLRHVVVDTTPSAARVVIGFGGPPPAEALAAAVAQAPGAAFVEVVRPRNHGILLAPTPIRGDAALHLPLGGDLLRATLPAWLPHAPSTVPAVRAAIVGTLGSAPGRVIEVGSGIGTTSLALARAGAEVVGIDVIREAVQDAAFNAERAGVQATFRTGRGDKALRRLAVQGADAVVLHGMRRPYGPQTLGPARALRPDRLTLVGPSAAALARDLAEVGPSFAVQSVRFIDQLPGTVGLLTVVALSRTP
jgi:23S rRNA (uracil1939-C5)-methyltransferase